MKEEWKFYVKGNASRGVEVIRVLTDLGAKNTGGVRGDCSEYYYFITMRLSCLRFLRKETLS